MEAKYFSEASAEFHWMYDERVGTPVTPLTRILQMFGSNLAWGIG
jgi:hypothetical protein